MLTYRCQDESRDYHVTLVDFNMAIQTVSNQCFFLFVFLFKKNLSVLYNNWNLACARDNDTLTLKYFCRHALHIS